METQNSGILAAQSLTPPPICLSARALPFGDLTQRFVPFGASIGDILRDLDIEKEYWPCLLVQINGDIVQGHFDLAYPEPNSIVSVAAMVQGGAKRIVKSIARIAIPLAAAALAGPIAGAILGPGIVAGSALGASLISGAVTAAVGFGLNAVGGLLLNAVAPPSVPRFNNSQARLTGGGATDTSFKDSPTWFIDGARNQLRPFEPVPVVLGTHRMVPPLGARGTIETEGNNQYARQLFLWGYGPVELSDIKIGETLLSEFDEVQQSHDLDGGGVPSVDLFAQSYDIEDLNIGLDTSYATRTTEQGVNEIIVDITCPQGLSEFDDQNKKNGRSVSFNIDYAPTGTTSWVTSTKSISASSTSAVRKSFRFEVSLGQYDVQIRRTSSESTDIKVRDSAFWTALKSVTYETPVTFEYAALSGLYIKATEQINGLVDQLNAVVSRPVLDWDSDAQMWIERVTDNPASLVRYVWQSPANTKALDDAQIDLEALQEWHEYCSEKGYTFNAVIDYETTVDQIVRDICAAGRGSPERVDDQWTVIVDGPKTFVSQHYNQRNSSNYQLEIAFPEEVHAFRVQFINRDKGWQQDEIIVYDDGYDETNATKFERLELFGVTETQAAFKLAREHIASIRLRPEVHSFTTDAESLPLVRGDRIKFSHDIPLIGLTAGRIRSVSDDGVFVTGIVVDEECPISGTDTDYFIRIRTADGSSLYKQVTADPENQSALSFYEPFDLLDKPEEGDLFTFGEQGTETLDLVVQRIEYSGDFKVRIYAVNYAPEIFDASDAPIPDYNPGITIPPSFKRPLPPIVLSVQSDESVQIRNLDDSITSRMVINLENKNIYAVEPSVEYRLTGTQEYLSANLVSRSPTQITIEGLDEGFDYDFLLRYKRLGEVTLGSNLLSMAIPLNGVRFVGNSAAPASVEGFDITVRSNSVFLSWDKLSVIDLAGYEIRFSPAISGATWESSLRIGPLRGRDDRSAVAPHRIGTYLIKAFDRSGNYSIDAVAVVTTIGQLDGLNAVDTIVEHASWGGVFNGTSESGGSLQLGGDDLWDDLGTWDDLGAWDYADGEIVNGGTYLFEGPDLGDVYTCVISAALMVSGANISDFIDNVGLWDDRETWDGTDPAQYDVRLMIRTTDDDPAGSPVTYTSWREIQAIGEYTFRHVKLMLVLTSHELNVTPVVSECTVTIDAPDRPEKGENISSGTGGKAVTFTNSFASACVPNVQIAVNDMSSGDYWLYTSAPDSDGFTIEFFDSSDTSVNRTFDYLASGYGRKS